jgi:hypothetical protein
LEDTAVSTPEELRRKAADLDRQADAELEAIEAGEGSPLWQAYARDKAGHLRRLARDAEEWGED